MSDGNKPGGSPFGWGGFGQPGVRETKVVGETSEIKIPRKQFLELWIFTWLLMVLGYGCLKLLVTTRGDWSLLVGILTLPVLFIGYLFFERQIAYKFFPIIYAQLIAAIQRAFGTDDIGRFILVALATAIVLLVSVGFYINTIVPQITLILDQQAQIVFVFITFFSLLFSFVPYYRFNRRQLVDSLRDSDSSYAKLSLQLESEERKRQHEARQTLLKESASDTEEGPSERLLDAPKKSKGESAFIQEIPYIHVSQKPTTRLNVMQETFKTAIFDFLDGIDDGRWSTNERSWRNDPIDGPKILINSRIPLMRVSGSGQSMGIRIRDWLMRSGLAEWKNPDDPQRGWELLYSTQEIRDGILEFGIGANSSDDGD